MTSRNPFDYVNAITVSKENLVADAEGEAGYNPFIANRALSYHADSVMYACEMNRRADLPKRMQFDYLRHSVRARRRVAKWHKRPREDKLDVVAEYFGFGPEKARQALAVLTDEQIGDIESKMNRGGEC